MKLSYLALTNFAGLGRSIELDFPDTGLFLVSGANGSGKSSLVEGISLALWGKSPRGSLPWGDFETRLRVHTSKLDVERVVKDGRALVTFHDTIDKPETLGAQKALPAVEALEGPWDIWKRTGLLSSADASHFGLAGDGDRKRLLESLLGLDRFDKALEKAKALHKANEERHRAALQKLLMFQARASNLAEQLQSFDSLKRQPPPEPPRPPLGVAERIKARAELNARMSEALKVSGEAQINHAAAGRALSLAGAKLKAAQSLTVRELCDLCGQRIVDAETVLRLEHEYRKQRSAAGIELDQAVFTEGATRRALEEAQRRTAVQEINRERVEIDRQDQMETVHQEWVTARQRESQYEVQRLRDRASVEAKLADVQKELGSLDVEKLRLAKGVTAAQYDILGLKGARARMFDSTLVQLENATNQVLDQLDGTLQVSLRPSREISSGESREELTLLVRDKNGTKSYLACSSGMRRRVDLGLLWALGQLARAVHGMADDETLWLDEPADSLDAEVLSPFAEMLEAASRTRLVLVISHRPDLASALNPDRHLHMEGGKGTWLK